MNGQKLIQNLIDQIKEVQLKIGYEREAMRFYYPLSSLNSLMQTDFADEKELFEAVGQQTYWKETCLGVIAFAKADGRIEVTVSGYGAEYVKNNVADPPFLEALIRLFRENPHCAVSEVQAVFAEFDPSYICKRMEPGTDFDYVMYFSDPAVDAYYYCIKSEMGHTIYHRFLKEDYEALFA